MYVMDFLTLTLPKEPPNNIIVFKFKPTRYTFWNFEM